MKKPHTGLLTSKFTFSVRATLTGPDGYGNTEGGWQDQFTVFARRQFVRGGEDVMAARLEGRQPVVLTVRKSTDTDDITTDWRATDARTGAVYNIRTVQPSEDRAWIDLLCESGVAV